MQPPRRGDPLEAYNLEKGPGAEGRTGRGSARHAAAPSIPKMNQITLFGCVLNVGGGRVADKPRYRAFTADVRN